MDIRKESLKKHYEWNGKIEVVSRVPINSAEALSLAYTPGVAEPCLEIQKDYDKSFELTRRNNLVAVVTDASVVNAVNHILKAVIVHVVVANVAVLDKTLDTVLIKVCCRGVVFPDSI